MNTTNSIKYYFYVPNGSRIVIFDESCADVKLFPEDSDRNFSVSKSVWMDYYKGEKDSRGPKMFEICENQFQKYKLHRTVPENWDY